MFVAKTTWIKQIAQTVYIPDAVQRFMVREIKNDLFVSKLDEKDFVPTFSGVNKKDADQLLFEAFYDQFQGIHLFTKNHEKSLMIEFSKVMEKKEYLPQQIIYDIGEQAKYFYVIR